MYSKATLASYATFKELYSSKQYKDSYQILAEFIRYIIVTQKKRDFTVIGLQDELNHEFGFKAPVSVIMHSLTGISGITILGRGEGYRADLRVVKQNDDFTQITNKAKEQSKKVTDSFDAYVEKTDKKKEGTRLSEAFMAFLLDEEGSKYSEIIGQFVLANEGNVEIKNAISSIREGNIIYSGLNYCIDDVEEINEPLTLFLDTEILFDLMGLNGSLYKSLAKDLISLVDIANKNGKVITLRYFSEVEKDLENYFFSAKQIIKDGEVVFDDAMKEILSDCDDESDVEIKQAKFFRGLHHEFGVRSDEKKNYNSTEDVEFSFEEMETGFPMEDKNYYEGVLFCSKINKLRKGKQTQNVLKSQYLCVTRTNKVLEVSKHFVEEGRNQTTGERYDGFAIGLSHITNILWSNLNRGFGSIDFPQNLDVVIKARLLLAGLITERINETFDNLKEQKRQNKISEDEANGVIIWLKQKHTKPEDYSSETIKEDLDFREQSVNRAAEERANDQKLIREKDDKINSLEEHVNRLEKQLEEAGKREEDSSKQLNELSTWKKKVEISEKQKKLEKRLKQAKKKLIISIVWKVIAVIASPFITKVVCGWLNVSFEAWYGIIVSLAGGIPTVISIIRKDIATYKAEKKAIQQEEEQLNREGTEE